MSSLILSTLQPDAKGCRTLTFRALGTECGIKFRMENEMRALEFAVEAMTWLTEFEAKFSRYKPDSIVSQVNAAAGERWVEVDEDMEYLLSLAHSLNRITKGLFDASLLPLLMLWDWKGDGGSLPTDASVAEAKGLVGWEKVERKSSGVFLPEAGMGIDFGGFGKEWAVDQIVAIARDAGIEDGLIDFGKDTFCMGGNGEHPFWHVGIEDGRAPGSCWGGMAVSDRAVCSSGDYARFFEHEGVRYGHMIDPRTGWPVRNSVRAVTAVAKTSLEAGIYSTSACIAGPAAGIEMAALVSGVDVCVQTDDDIQASKNFSQWLVQPVRCD